MRFAATSRASNVVAAGVNAARAGLDAHDAARASSPRYSRFGIQAIKQDAEKFQQRQAGESAAARAGINAATQIKKTEVEIDAKKSIDNSKKQARKAGAVAAGAVLLAKSVKPVKDETATPGLYPDLTSKIQAQKAKIEKMRSERGGLYKTDGTPATKETPTEKTVDTTTTTKSGTPLAGKITNKNGIEQTVGWNKLSRVIRFAEGTSGEKGYNTQFGGRQFEDMSAHPNSPMATGWGTESEAAGAYQFMKPTWDGVKKATGVTDFSPQSQEIGGRYLTTQRGVNPDAVFKTKDELKAALHKLAPEWASLPMNNGKSRYNQPVKTLDELWSVYQGL